MPLALAQRSRLSRCLCSNIRQMNTSPQLSVICKVIESADNSFIRISNKDIKVDVPQHQRPGNTTHDWSPTGFNSIHHHPLGQFFTQERGHKSKPWAARFSRTVLGETVSKALLHSRHTTSTAFPSSREGMPSCHGRDEVGQAEVAAKLLIIVF